MVVFVWFCMKFIWPPLLEAIEERHPYGYDLDIFGPGSVRALLGPTPTPTGTETLRRWLSGPAAPEEIERRQSAVAALAADVFYIGALGSTRTHAKRVERMTEAGFTPAQIARIHGPIGLDIGAAGPSEIAVAVLAQMTQVLRQGA